jgi:hypothetical protein
MTSTPQDEPAARTVAALIAPIVAHVVAFPGQTMPQIVQAFPHVPSRTVYRVIQAAVAQKLVRREPRAQGSLMTVIFPYGTPKATTTPAVRSKDGHAPAVWVHPIRARALGLPVATRAASRDAAPPFPNPLRGAAT